MDNIKLASILGWKWLQCVVFMEMNIGRQPARWRILSRRNIKGMEYSLARWSRLAVSCEQAGCFGDPETEYGLEYVHSHFTFVKRNSCV